jgi:hypothetical protein
MWSALVLGALLQAVSYTGVEGELTAMCVIYRRLVPIEHDGVKVDTLLVDTIVSTEHLRDKKPQTFQM